MTKWDDGMSEYWKNKVKIATIISKEHGYEMQDEEFWSHQPAGVVSLICEIVEASVTFIPPEGIE